MTLKNKMISGAIWNGLEIFGGRFVQIFITIILARILSPKDFGIIALLVIFLEVSKVISDCGFSKALISKKDITPLDYSSIFYFNIIISLIIYIFLFLISPYISDFYQFEKLTTYSRFLFIIILINAFGIVPNALIVKKINFKVLAKRTFIANIISGLVAIYLAYSGYGVWALVYQIIISSVIRVISMGFLRGSEIGILYYII